MKKSHGIDKVMSAVIDCDLYKSYQDSLNFIWPKLSEGGFIHLDEYYSLKYPGARRATLEFISDKPDAFLNEKVLMEILKGGFSQKNEFDLQCLM